MIRQGYTYLGVKSGREFGPMKKDTVFGVGDFVWKAPGYNAWWNEDGKPKNEKHEALMCVPREKKPVTKASLLDAAKEAVADRGLNYGKPEDNFRRIAELWNAHFYNIGVLVRGQAFAEIQPADVAQMMVLMKVARLENDPNHLDSWTDIAGYAACGAEITNGKKDA